MVSKGRWRWKDGRFVRSLILLEKVNRTDECKNDEDEQDADKDIRIRSQWQNFIEKSEIPLDENKDRKGSVSKDFVKTRDVPAI
ncbi:hypothetical protein HZH66_005538 [Vespula vulgaris]|uniref:Uncharacterized protein n=1 Tax=Vespula vulgaris TaxID=7454 RepID=A0A834N9X5_VESVU|nr:hypothetical protein HZH66_005538 [Vespula vulgaris]